MSKCLRKQEKKLINSVQIIIDKINPGSYAFASVKKIHKYLSKSSTKQIEERNRLFTRCGKDVLLLKCASVHLWLLNAESMSERMEKKEAAV